MHYRTFTGKSKQEAYALFNAEKKTNPELKDARLIKDSEKTVSSFMGLKQNQIYEIVIGIPEHTSFLDRSFPKPSSKQEKNTKFTPIERSVINNKKPTISEQAQDTLFAIDGVTKVAAQLSQLERSFPSNHEKDAKLKKVVEKPQHTKELELKKELSNIRNEVKELKLIFTNQQQYIQNSQLVDSLQESRELPDEYEIQKQHIRWIEKYLIEREFSQSLIEDLLQHLENTPEILTDKKTILKSVEQFLQNHIPQTDISLDHYHYGREIIFVGPTGVGKTSTLVKLAAHLSLMRKKSFRFISIDRYKVGGETQLEKLAGYMNTQFYAINKQEEFFNLLTDTNHDFTFIDTAGKGPKDSIAIQELSHWITMIGHPIDIHLVVSATTKVTDLEYICDSYHLLNYNHILVTKLDETKTFGSIISLAYKYQKHLSFITDGQEIPQDFEIADIRYLIKEALK
ncbi:MAG: hypothetical protein ACRC0X_09755 [Brevinema sp.]